MVASRDEPVLLGRGYAPTGAHPRVALLSYKDQEGQTMTPSSAAHDKHIVLLDGGTATRSDVQGAV